MKNGTILFAALMIAVALVIGSSPSVSAQCGDPGCTSCASVMPAPTVVANCGCGQSQCTSCAPVASCGCGQASCAKCRLPRPLLNRRQRNTQCGCEQPAKCAGDTCKLELDDSKVKKTCFKTEQKSVCVPSIRFPWMKCCPPGTSKTRLVNKLSTHKYECPNCTYKWSVQEAEAPKQPTQAQPQVFESTPVYDSYIPQSGTIQPANPSIQQVDQGVMIETYTPPTNLVPSVTPDATLVPQTTPAVPNSVLPPTAIPAEAVPPPTPTGGTSSSSNLAPWNVQAKTGSLPTVRSRR